MDKRQHIVVVEDEAAQRQLLFDYLTRHGYRVTGFQSGVGLRRMVEREMPALVLLDIGLPDFNGYELAAKIRALPWGRGVILIAVTGWGQEEDRARALEAGCDHHLTKPIAPETVESLLQSFDPAFRRTR